MTPRQFIEHAMVGDVVEAYDILEQLLNSVRKHAPQHASRIETARDLVFSVRVALESDGDES